MLRRFLVVFVLWICGCSAEPSPSERDAGTVDSGPPEDRFGEPIAAFQRQILAVPVLHAAELSGGAILAAQADGLVLVQTSTTIALGSAVGGLAGAVTIEGGALVAGSGGFFVLANDELRASPLGDVLRGVIPHALLGAPGPGIGQDIWIAGTEDLHLWRDGQSFQVRPGDLPARNAALAFGAPIDSRAALWVAAERSVYGIVATASGVEAYPEQPDLAATALAVDGAGTLWVLAEGKLKSRNTRGEWRDHPLLEDVRVMVASADSARLWVGTAAGLWQYEDFVFHPLTDAPRADALALSRNGTLLVSSSSGLYRVSAGRAVELVGIEEGAVLEAAVTIEIRPLLDGEVLSVRAQLDGAELTVMNDPWRVALDPTALADGEHALTVILTYGGGLPEVQATLHFRVSSIVAPTWSADIEPLFEARCAICHGERGSAHRLDTAAQWMVEIGVIITNVRDGRMPLPPNPRLSSEDVQRIVSWQAAGFPN